MKVTRKITVIAVVAAVMVAGGVTGGILAAGSPGQVMSKGGIEVDTSVDDASQDPCDGAQVIILAPSGSVIGSASLHAGPTTESAVLGQEEISTMYTWKMALPPESRYGIQACGTSHGTQWETPAQVKAGTSLDLDLTDFGGMGG